MFISYRAEDTGPIATWLFQDLADAYGREHVFLDHERLEGGAPWPQRLEEEARRASVMLVLIGDGWLRAHDPDTVERRLDQPGDWVRKEIETALDAGSLVVPLLVEDTKQLSRRAFETLPSLAPLADLQSLTLRRKDRASDLKRLHELLASNGFVRRQPSAGSSGAAEAAELETALARNKAKEIKSNLYDRMIELCNKAKSDVMDAMILISVVPDTLKRTLSMQEGHKCALLRERLPTDFLLKSWRSLCIC